MNDLFQGAILFALFALVFSPEIQAQQNPDSTAYLNIDSNYDSFYIVIDDDIATVQKKNRNDLFEIDKGEHLITIIPEFSPAYRFKSEFLADSFYVATLNFGHILDEQNSIYKKIESEEILDQEILEDLNYSLREGSFRLVMYNKAGYYNRSKGDINYQNTYLKINTNTDSVFVHTNVFKETARIASGDSILIPPGTRRITLSHQRTTEHTITRKFEKETTTTINHDFNLQEPSLASLTDNIATQDYYHANLLVISDEDSKITVNGKKAGSGAVKLRQETGPVKISIDNPKTGTHTFHTKITNLPREKATVVNAYTKPKKSDARLLGIFPGMSQLYKRQKLKAISLSAGFLVLGGLAIRSNRIYNNELIEFNLLKDRYYETTKEQRALELGDLLEEKQNFVKRKDNERVVFFALASLLYAFNIYDAIFSKPKSGYRTKTDLKLQLNSQTISGKDFSSLSIKYDF